MIVDSGDDCALVKCGYTRILLKTDTVVEGTHFTRAATPRRIGHKAMGKPLSDFAAMGAAPEFALAAVSLPRRTSQRAARGIYLGMEALARRFRVRLVGGDVVTTRGPLAVTVSLVGEAPRAPVLRSGAKPGDTIYLTGPLAAGRHLTFMPRVREGIGIARAGATAMIDVTDGLVRDLGHLCRASAVGAELHDIPRVGSLQQALYGGEDFELLFTARRSRWLPIGTIVRRRGIRLRGRALPDRGYEHAFG